MVIVAPPRINAIVFCDYFAIDKISPLVPSWRHQNELEVQQVKKQKMMAPIRLTEQQMKWLEREAARTGNSMASVIRSLVQGMVEGAK